MPPPPLTRRQKGGKGFDWRGEGGIRSLKILEGSGTFSLVASRLPGNPMGAWAGDTKTNACSLPALNMQNYSFLSKLTKQKRGVGTPKLA